MRIHKDETIAVIIDIQAALFPHIHESEKLEKNTIRLIKGLNAIDIPIVVTQQYTAGLRPTIDSISEAVGEYTHIEKMSFSCCDDPRFDEDLAVSSKRNVLIAGIETHVCVLQTVIDLIDRGFHPVVVEDCVSSRNPNDKKIAIERMRQAGAIITTYESVLFELLRYSGTKEFKAISKIVK
ncbi:MAG: hydrolase [Bacteroidota bacterium]|nr:hydrolase [Bacteroidota bacterium]